MNNSELDFQQLKDEGNNIISNIKSREFDIDKLSQEAKSEEALIYDEFEISCGQRRLIEEYKEFHAPSELRSFCWLVSRMKADGVGTFERPVVEPAAADQIMDAWSTTTPDFYYCIDPNFKTPDENPNLLFGDYVERKLQEMGLARGLKTMPEELGQYDENGQRVIEFEFEGKTKRIIQIKADATKAFPGFLEKNQKIGAYFVSGTSGEAAVLRHTEFRDKVIEAISPGTYYAGTHSPFASFLSTQTISDLGVEKIEVGAREYFRFPDEQSRIDEIKEVVLKIRQTELFELLRYNQSEITSVGLIDAAKEDMELIANLSSVEYWQKNSILLDYVKELIGFSDFRHIGNGIAMNSYGEIWKIGEEQLNIFKQSLVAVQELLAREMTINCLNEISEVRKDPPNEEIVAAKKEAMRESIASLKDGSELEYDDQFPGTVIIPDFVIYKRVLKAIGIDDEITKELIEHEQEHFIIADGRGLNPKLTLEFVLVDGEENLRPGIQYRMVEGKRSAQDIIDDQIAVTGAATEKSDMDQATLDRLSE